MTNATSTSGTTTSPAAPAPSAQPAKAIKPAKAAKPAASAATEPAKKAETKKAPATKKTVAPKAPKAAATVVAKDVKAKKPKLVRDSFTIPKDEYAVIETLKQRAATLAQPVKKSELLRAGLKVLAGLSDTALRGALQAVPSIKTGRPKAEAPAPAAAPATKANTKSRK
ncbi:hypothetical protein [Acidovorax kalamii]|uniref:Uncharacterized protein n=1 Tax=Acidovorax kalamii TaxID=2004485 RepID=A0A235ES46_9BURK|nr:hypothetical protein [Acidovorax kalamii]OYD51613.1 hypothetical protein CBY09_07440 [Acidovorax kalamii]